MREMTKRFAALGALGVALLGSTTPSLAGRYRTPTAEQARFYDDLRSGKRPIARKVLTSAQRRAVEAPPRTAAVGETSSAVSAAAAPITAGSTAVYFSAHPDDFLLFMNPYRDVVQGDTKAVFVFLTAGDAGLGKGPKSAPYYLARENGAQRAIRFMADAATTTTPDPNSGWVLVAGHAVYRTIYKNTVSYYLRLPDGSGEGSGYPLHDWASLIKLKNGEIRSIRAVDGSATYTSWADLVKTLTTIVKTQAAGSPNVWLDTHEIDPVASPGDHSDHLATGLAVAAIQPSLPCVNLAHHVGYANSGLVNLDLDDIENRAATFANYASGQAEKGYPGVIWEPTHKSWLAGMVMRLAPGNGQTCAF